MKTFFRNCFKKQANPIHVFIFHRLKRYNNIIYKTAIKPRVYASQETQERQSNKTGSIVPTQENLASIYLFAFQVKRAKKETSR